jgi:hypothetical protein
MLELFLFEIDVEKQKDTQRKKRGKEKTRCSKVVFFNPSFYETLTLLLFPLFLNFVACEKLNRHPPNKNKIKYSICK